MSKFEEDHNEPNMFGEQIVATSLSDFDETLPEGTNGPAYQINFGKTQIRILKDSQIKAEYPLTKLKPGFSNTDYKAVMAMMADVKILSLEDWKHKYIVES